MNLAIESGVLMTERHYTTGVTISHVVGDIIRRAVYGPRCNADAFNCDKLMSVSSADEQYIGDVRSNREK